MFPVITPPSCTYHQPIHTLQFLTPHRDIMLRGWRSLSVSVLPWERHGVGAGAGVRGGAETTTSTSTKITISSATTTTAKTYPTVATAIGSIIRSTAEALLIPTERPQRNMVEQPAGIPWPRGERMHARTRVSGEAGNNQVLATEVLSGVKNNQPLATAAQAAESPATVARAREQVP